MNSKQLIKKAIAPFLSPFYHGRGHILMFHRVVPDTGRERIHNTVNEITPAKLAEIIDFYLRHDIDIISLDEIEHYLNSRNKKQFVCFTFDDGFRDNFTEALPVFESYKAPFAVYVTTGFPDYTIIIWWYLLEKILLENDNIEINWGKEQYKFKAGTAGEKEDVFTKIRRIIINTPYEEQADYLQHAFSKYTQRPHEMTMELAMSWDELKALSVSKLVTIGAHTMSHPALNQLTREEIVNETLGSKEKLEKLINKEIKHFSYPFGSVREVGKREMEIVKDLGFMSATTTRAGVLFRNHLKYMESLPRIAISPDTTIEMLQGLVKGREMFMRNSKNRIVVD